MKCAKGDGCVNKSTAVAVPETADLSWDNDNGHDDGQKAGHFFDLNDEKTQEKILNLILYGAPPADKKGHSEHIQCKIIPYHLDIMDGVRALAPKGHWRSQSEYLRCAFTVGTFVIMKYLKNSQDIPDLNNLFDLYEMMAVVAKQQRQESLKNDFSRALAVVTEHQEDVQNMVGILNSKLTR
jgi:hypothetical protein